MSDVHLASITQALDGANAECWCNMVYASASSMLVNSQGFLSLGSTLSEVYACTAIDLVSLV